MKKMRSRKSYFCSWIDQTEFFRIAEGKIGIFLLLQENLEKESEKRRNERERRRKRKREKRKSERKLSVR